MTLAASPGTTPGTVHALYRFHDESGALLYVGITNNPGRRWTEHQQGKPWWHQVHRVDVEHHPDRAAALLAESAAIRAERPRFNIAGAGRPDIEPGGSRIQCAECERIAIGVYVLSAEIDEYREWRKKVNDPDAAMSDLIVWGDQLDTVPFPAPWRGCCTTHLPDDNAVHYWFDGATSRRAAVDVVRHLAEKEWVGELTAWGSLAVRLLAPAEAALPRGVAWYPHRHAPAQPAPPRWARTPNPGESLSAPGRRPLAGRWPGVGPRPVGVLPHDEARHQRARHRQVTE